MVINFLLPRPAKKPVGGYKIVFEYAERLGRRGHHINIIYNMITPFSKPSLIIPRYIYDCLKLKPSWFEFSSKISLGIACGNFDSEIPDADITVATWWETAYICRNLPASKGKKYYLIQHYETWCGDKTLVDNSYKIGLENIAISNWVKEKIDLTGGKVKEIIPNGVNLEEFHIKTPIDERFPYSVAMMYHTAEWKGSKDGIEALESVKTSMGDLRVTLFGVDKKPSWIPRWINYVRNPDKYELIRIYNQAAVFLSTSWYEGFGLPGAEALACGCALVTTDSGGVREYALEGRTAVICNPRKVKEIADSLRRVLLDKKLRNILAVEGNKYINNFDWDKSVDRFEKCIG